MTRLPPEWEIDQGNEALLEEMEAGWGATSASLRAAIIDYVTQMADQLPGLRLGLEFVAADRVKVKIYPPRTHPAFDPAHPTEHLVTVFGVSK